MIFNAGMDITLEDGASKTKTTVCGWKDGKYLLVEGANSIKTRINAHLVARLSRNGCHYRFSTSTLGLFPEINLTALSYPDYVEEFNTRKAARYAVMAPVKIGKSAGGPTLDENGLLTDLSAGDVRFECRTKFAPGEVVYLDGFLPVERSAGVEVIVRNVEDIGGLYEYGAQFAAIDVATRNSLIEFIEALRRVAPDEPALDASTTDKSPAAPVNGQVIIQIENMTGVSTFRGMSRRHIIIDAPLVDGHAMMVDRITPAIVKFEDSGMAYQLLCMVFKQYTSPANIWVLSRPTEMRSVSISNSQRTQVFIPPLLNSDGTHRRRVA